MNLNRDPRRLSIEGKPFVVIYDARTDSIEVWDPETMRLVKAIKDIGYSVSLATAKSNRKFGFDKYDYQDAFNLIRREIRPLLLDTLSRTG